MNRKSIAWLGVALLALLAAPATAATDALTSRSLTALPTLNLNTSAEAAIDSLANKPTTLILALKLTPAQVETLRGLITTLRNAVTPLRASNSNLEQQLRTALGALNPDNCAIGRLVIQEHTNNLAISVAFDKFDRAFSAILTPEQLAKYERLKKLLLGRLAVAPAAALADAGDN